MTNNRPFAYNTGSLIAGTTQVGTIAVGQLNIAYNTNYGGVDWWGGPNENVGYVIAHSDPTGGHNGEPGVPAYLGFWQKPGFTEADFLSLANDIPPRIGYTPFVSANAAVVWLNNNGYWTNYGYATPTPTAGPVSTPTPTVTSTHTSTPTGTPVSTTPTPTPTHSSGPISSPTPTPTPSVTQTQTPTGTPASTPTPTPTHSTPSGFSVTIVESGGDVVMSASGSLNINDLTLVNSSFGPIGGGGLGVNSATFLMGTFPANGAQYSGFTTTPSNFGPGAGGGGATSSSGGVFGVIFQGAPPYSLVVPVGYTTGTAISSTQTFSGATFSSLGLTPGTYTYTWGSGANADSINVVVGGAGVTPTPTATSQTPTPTPTSGSTGPGWYFYSADNSPVLNPPSNNGDTTFINNGSGNGTYNPNYTGGTFNLYFNTNNSVGTSYLSQFTGLDTTGGTITISQGSNTVIYSGTSSNYTIFGSLYLQLIVTSPTQMIQSASTPFVSGTSINVVVS